MPPRTWELPVAGLGTERGLRGWWGGGSQKGVSGPTERSGFILRFRAARTSSKQEEGGIRSEFLRAMQWRRQDGVRALGVEDGLH